MGQPITVTEKPAGRDDIVRFDLNRSLTGMGHERYRADREIVGDRPPDELARRLFAHGGVEAVHIYSNVVTIDLAPGASPQGLADVVHGLFVHYDHEEEAPATTADPATTAEGVTEAAE
ncbi:MAG: NifU N-terminal domain-containing protein [Acidimicrobiia bacterium]|nr:NifU N-terminal domain-containing protein [Acidimicrobiia bacterium]